MAYCIIFSTAGSQIEADKIAAALLENRVASCVQMTPIQSAYHWKGKVERADEIHLVVKTRDELYPKVAEIIKSNHSYETPQIVKIPITDGLPAYLDWIKSETKS
ncbi:MAG: divalent-cation tolerance protein CutA [Alphaproteobacteria bacterium]|nr:divalent-cation tolerance protein CutA [Alphaproteobacteria bacterium]